MSPIAISCVALLLSAAQACAAETVSTREIPRTDALPIMPQAALRLGLAGAVDRQSTLAVDPRGGFTLVYETARDPELRDLQMHVLRSEDGRHIDEPRKLDLIRAAVVGSAALVPLDGATWLYFASAEGLTQGISLWRSRLGEDGFATPEALPAVSGLSRMMDWPRWVGSEHGVTLSFRNRKSRPHWAHAADGREFRSQLIQDIGAAYVRVVPMPGGGWFGSHQRPPQGGYMATYVSVSADGQTWSNPRPITWPEPPRRPDVHDAFALPRRDRGVDLYYSYPTDKSTPGSPKAGFNLYRRAVLGADRFGPEQLLTAPEHFNPFSSSAHRLPGGEVLLSFADILEVRPGIGVSRAQLVLSRLPGDAPVE